MKTTVISMNGDKIGELARVMTPLRVCDFNCDECANADCNVKAHAVRVLDANYAKVEDTIDEFIKRLKKLCENETIQGECVSGDDGRWHSLWEVMDEIKADMVGSR